MNNTLYCCDEVAGVLEPAVGIADDAAGSVLLDFVAVDGPLQRSLTIDYIPYASSGILVNCTTLPTSFAYIASHVYLIIDTTIKINLRF